MATTEIKSSEPKNIVTKSSQQYCKPVDVVNNKCENSKTENVDDNKYCTNDKENDLWTLFHNNLRSLDSKRIMFQKIIQEVQPRVISLNELNFKAKRRLKIPGYQCFNKNRENVKGGGVGLAVASDDSKHVLKIREGDNNEMIVTRHSQFVVPINVLSIYGEQECRVGRNRIDDSWNEVIETLATITRPEVSKLTPVNTKKSHTRNLKLFGTNVKTSLECLQKI